MCLGVLPGCMSVYMPSAEKAKREGLNPLERELQVVSHNTSHGIDSTLNY